MTNGEILKNIVNDFRHEAEIEAIALSGSATSAQADEISDFDIYIYSDSEISPEIRRQIAQKYSDKFEINNQYWETGDEWTLRETGKGIDIMYRSREWIEGMLERVLDRKEASLGYTTCFVFNVKNSEILYDKQGWYKSLRDKASQPYSEELSRNIINKNLPLLIDKPAASYYEQIVNALKRGDLVSVNHRTAAFLASYFDILFAANEMLHPGEKRLVKYCLKNCEKLPENFEQDINKLALLPKDEIKDLIPIIAGRLKNVI